MALTRIKEIWAFAGLGSDSEKGNTSSVAHGGDILYFYAFLLYSPCSLQLLTLFCSV